MPSVEDELATAQHDKAHEYRQIVGGFQPTLTNLLYAYGDDKEARSETVAVLADCVLEFMAEVCTLPPRPRPTPPTYGPIPSKRIPYPSLPALRRTLGRSRHHARKYAHLQEFQLALRHRKAIEAARQAASKAGVGGAGAGGGGGGRGGLKDLGLDMGEDLSSLAKLGE